MSKVGGSEGTKPDPGNDAGTEMKTVFRVTDPITLSTGRVYKMRKLKMPEILSVTPVLVESMRGATVVVTALEKDERPEDKQARGLAFMMSMARSCWRPLSIVYSLILTDITDGEPGQPVKTDDIYNMDFDDGMRLVQRFFDMHEGVIQTFFGLVNKVGSVLGETAQ